MKKIITAMALVLALSTILMTAVSCGSKAEYKLGLGIVTEASATDATPAEGDTAAKNGTGTADITAAAVLVDEDGKIAKVFIDCAQNKVSYTVNGEAVANTEFKTKYEKGNEYGMKAYGGSAKEWFEQIDAFCNLIIGKTSAEVKALLGSDNKGTQDVINAGCTIDIGGVVKAVEKAIANAVASNNTIAAEDVKLGVSTTQSTTDYNTEDAKDGQNQVDTTFFAAAVDADGKVVASITDCVQVKFTFNATGVSTFNADQEIRSKLEKGDAYGMKAYGGSAKEWYEQAAAFDAACAGKTVDEIAGLMGAENKGNADLQAAGCTITIDEFVKAASKIK